MIEIVNGMILIDGKITTNAELIGLTLLDFAELLENDGLVITLKDADVFVKNVGKCIYADKL